MLLLLIFILVPIIEIAAFIEIGNMIGLWPTIGCIIVTAMVGTFVLRLQGLSVLRQAQDSMQNNQVPVDSVFHGAFLLIAGALLLTPGFFTDAIGFILLFPPARTVIAQMIWSRLKGRVQFHQFGTKPGPDRQRHDRPGAGPVIEGEAVVIDEHEPSDTDDSNSTPTDQPKGHSPWNR